MAWKLVELFADITARDGKFRAAMKRVQANAQAASRKMGEVSRHSRRMLMGLGAGLAGVVTASSGFEKSMSRVKAVTRASGEEFETLRRTALELGRTTQFSASQAANAMSQFAIAGFKTREIVAAMPHALNLAAAGELNMAEAAGIASNVMRGMGLNAEELARATDVMAAAFTTSNTDLRQLGEAMKFVGPVAKSTGKSLEETVSVIQVLSNAGIQASMAGTSLRRILSKLAEEAGKSNGPFQDLGVSITDSNGRIRNMADIIRDLNKAMAGMTEAEKSSWTMEQFGQRAGPAMAALLNEGSEALRNYQMELAGSEGLAKRIAEEQLDNFRGSLTKLISAVEGAAISIGTVFHGALRKVVDALQNAASYMASLSDSTKQSIRQWVGATAAVLGAVMAFSKLSQIILLVTAHPLVALVTALAAAGVAITKFMIQTGELGRIFEGEFKNVGNIMSWLKGWWDKIVDGIIYGFISLKVVITNWKDSLRYMLLAATKGVVSFSLDVWHWFTKKLPEYVRWFVKNWMDIFTDWFNWTKTLLQNMWKNFKNLFKSIWAWMKGDEWEFEWTNLTEGFKRTAKELPKIAKREMSDVERVMGEEMRKIADRMNTEFNKEYQRIQNKRRPQVLPKKGKGPAIKDVEGPSEGEPPGGAVPQLAGGDGAGIPDLGKTVARAAFIGVAQMARKIQTAAASEEKKIQKQQLMNMKKTRETLEEMNQRDKERENEKEMEPLE
jgi:TP901 family phage tail tape measure protein